MQHIIFWHERVKIMHELIFYTPCSSSAIEYASGYLQKAGYTVTDKLSQNATHLLLPVPSFTPQGTLFGGGDLQEVLSQLPENIVIVGGNLNNQLLEGYPKLDLLKNPEYLAQNANITAHCAIRLAMNQLSCTLWDLPILVIGWGRIGKVLCKLLTGLGAKVSICARSPADRAMAHALGYLNTDIPQVEFNHYRVVFNTVPVMLFPDTPPDVLKIDLASLPGLGGDDVIHARGLPSKNAPENSGTLIAETLLDYLRKEKL